MKHFFLFFLLVLMSQVNLIHAQNPYVRDGSIGKQKADSGIANKKLFSFRPITLWVGERFIFLPRPKKLQQFDYMSFKGGDGRFGHLSYNKYVGRTGEVITVNKQDTIWDIELEMEDDRQKVIGTAYIESLDGIAPVADIDNARTMWLGKTLWYKGKGIATYNADTGEFGSVKVKKLSPLKVIDIVAGWYSHTPVRFILKTPSGEEGFVDKNLSGTNVSNILRSLGRFEDSFFTIDPRTIYNWPSEIWTAIEEGNVIIGMTEEQAKLSWGKPKEINRTVTRSVRSEQWVYGNGNYLYFEDGILRSIQN